MMRRAGIEPAVFTRWDRFYRPMQHNQQLPPARAIQLWEEIGIASAAIANAASRSGVRKAAEMGADEGHGFGQIMRVEGDRNISWEWEAGKGN